MIAVQRTRLLLVDDHPVMQAGLADRLGSERGFSAVAQADGGEAAYSLWQQHQPDVTHLDLAMHGIEKLGVGDRTRVPARAFDLGLLKAAADHPERR